MSEEVFWRFIAFAWGQFSWSTSGQFSEKCQNTFSVGPLHTCLGSTGLTQPLNVLCSSNITRPPALVIEVLGCTTRWVVTKRHCRWRGLKVLVKKRWSWSITSSVTGAACTGHRGSICNRSKKNQLAVFDHCCLPCLRQNTCKPRWTRLSVCPYLFRRRVPQTTKVPSAHRSLAPCLVS